MSSINRCPDCGRTLVAKIKRCTCGWIVVQEIKNAVNDYRCHFAEFGERCESDGTVCNSIRGNRWYCGKHWYNGQ